MSKEILQKFFFTAIHDSIDYKKIDQYLQQQKTTIFAVGKGANAFAKYCEKHHSRMIKKGFVISNKIEVFEHFKVIHSSHPHITSKSIQAADILIHELTKLQSNEPFIFFLSGGTSAMIEKPIEGISLDDLTKINQALLTCGIDIKALNSVRKQLSQIKGGKLAQMIPSRNGVVLVQSDVVGNDLDTIGSAPMMNGKYPHVIIGDNSIALKALKKSIQKEFDKVKIVTTTLDLNSQDASLFIKKNIEKYTKKYKNFCLLFGGETTTNVVGDGKGGRNQELALRLLLDKAVSKNISILCAGSDGQDGNNQSAGAFLDFEILQKIKEKNLNPKKYLKNSDSNTFFKALGYDFTPGLTGINIMDFVFIIKR